MTPSFGARRRAEEFASLVEHASTDADPRYDDLLELVQDLRTSPPVEARPGFALELRERLMVAAETALVPGGKPQPLAPPPAVRRTVRERAAAVAIGGVAVLGATTSMAIAAQSALPGDTLYPLKRAVEDIHAGVQVDEDDRAATILDSASGRLSEVDELSRTGDSDRGVAIADTLQTFTDQATEASDLLLAQYAETSEPATIEQLRTFTDQSMNVLTSLQDAIPTEARGALIQASQTLGQINELTRFACPICPGSDLLELPRLASQPLEDLLGLAGSQPPAAPVQDGSTEQKPQQSKNAKNSKSDGGKKDRGGSESSTIEQPADSGSTPEIRPPDTNGPQNSGSGPVENLVDGIKDGLSGGKGKSNTSKNEPRDGLGGLLDGVGGTVGSLFP